MTTPDATRDRVLVTGAAGYVAGLILPRLRSQFALRLLDWTPQIATDDDEVVTADIADIEQVTRACFGVSAVVHLAAKGFEDDFMSVLLPRNIVGTYTVLEAARRAGLRSLVFASTGQTVGGNPDGLRITPDMPPRPISVYACTNLF